VEGREEKRDLLLLCERSFALPKWVEEEKRSRVSKNNALTVKRWNVRVL